MFTIRLYELVLITTALILLVGGCGYTQQKGNAGSNDSSSGGQSGASKLVPTLSSIQQNIFNSRCVSCHNGPSGSGGVSLVSFADIISSKIIVPGSPSASRLFQEIESGRMPRGGVRLSQAELEAVAQWILSGATP